MTKYYLNQERKLFNFLSRKFSKNKKIYLNHEFLPKDIKDNVVNVNYTSTGDAWFIRFPVNDNEIFYYFGVSKFGSKPNNDISLRLILKFSPNENNSFIKFLENGEVAIKLKIKNNNVMVYDFLRENFNLIPDKNSSGNYLIILGDYTASKIILNIRYLVRLVEFDLNLKNDILVVNNIIKYNFNFKSIKIKTDQKVSDSKFYKPVNKSNSKIKQKKYSKINRTQIKNHNVNKNKVSNEFDKNNTNSSNSTNLIENNVENQRKNQESNFNKQYKSINPDEYDDKDIRYLLSLFKEYISKPLFKMDIRKFGLTNDEIGDVINRIVDDIVQKKISKENINFKSIINEYCRCYSDNKTNNLSDDDLENLINEVNVANYDEDIVKECKLRTIHDYKSNKINETSIKIRFNYHLKKKTREQSQLETLKKIIESPDIPGVKIYLTIDERNEIYDIVKNEICSEFGINNFVLDTVKYKMNRKVEKNKSAAREKLTNFIYNRKYFIEVTNLDNNQIEPFIKELEYLIDINEIKANNINEDFLRKLSLVYLDSGRIIL